MAEEKSVALEGVVGLHDAVVDMGRVQQEDEAKLGATLELAHAAEAAAVQHAIDRAGQAEVEALARAEADALAEVCSLTTFPQGALVLRAGAVAGCCAVVLEGRCEGPPGEGAHADEWLGAAAWLQRHPRVADVSAATDVICATLDQDGLQKLNARRPQVRPALLARPRRRSSAA